MVSSSTMFAVSLLGFNKFEPWCGRQLILSNEGIYISFDKSFAKDNLGVDARRVSDSKALTDLMLADGDYNNYQTNELLQYYIKTECQIIMMSLRNARKLCKKNNFFVLIIIGITKLFFIRVMVNYSDQCA